MSVTAKSTAPVAEIVLRFGPLCYQFSAGDAWGENHLLALARHFSAAASTNSPDRIVYLARQCPSATDIANNRLRSPLGVFEMRDDESAVLWTETAVPELPPFRYQLPWTVLLRDMARIGGAIAHAGLVMHEGRGLLFLAPPGGGKSTTLATAPADWEVLSDDAALVWPATGEWLASPLPSWTMMTATESASPGQTCDPSRRVSIAGLLILVKARELVIEPMAPIEAAAHLFRALSEYPSTVLTALPHTEHHFRTGCRLARALPCWRLSLPLGADAWPRLASLLKERP